MIFVVLARYFNPVVDKPSEQDIEEGLSKGLQKSMGSVGSVTDFAWSIVAGSISVIDINALQFQMEVSKSSGSANLDFFLTAVGFTRLIGAERVALSVASRIP